MAQLATQIQDALGPDYRLDEELPGGGMSRLFTATDLRLDRRVVVKVLSPDLESDTSIARFRREIELTVRLQHPHILPVLTSGTWAEGLFYITPYIHGESLRARIAREGRLPLRDVLQILDDVSGALAYAHAHSVVHRDVKPGNILLSEGHAFLADFGIARAITTTATPLTGGGMHPGTPAYMAPELPTDERADLYALGLVGCEMLCGALPYRGAGAADLVTARGRVTGDSRPVLRRLARILARATALVPERRFLSCSDLETAIRAAPGRAVKWPLVAATIAAAALALAALVQDRWRPAPEIRRLQNPLVVVPFSATAHADSSLAATFTSRVRDALREWREDTLVDDGRLREATARNAGQRYQLSDALRVARTVNARSLVWGEIVQAGSEASVSATLYDVKSGRAIQSRTTPLAGNADTSSIMTARRVVNGLIRTSDEMPWRSADDHRTASLTAWRHYDDGQAAIARWDLVQAEAAFRAAIGESPDLTQAHLWLAQTLYWRLDAGTREDRKTEAKRAFSFREGLSPRDSMLAQALNALSDSNFPDACGAYRGMIQRDSADVVGWLGLADCQVRDATVIKSPTSPSGWRFRASFADAERAILQASYIAPATMDPAIRSWVLSRLATIVDVEELRYGAPVGGGDAMYARAYLDHDTLVFIPYSAALIASGRVDPPAAARDSAIEHSRDAMRRAAEHWVARAQNDPAAWVALARIAEASGVAVIGGREYAPVDVVKRARSLERDSLAQLRLEIFQVRLFLKQSDFASAASLADSASLGLAARHPEVPGAAGLAVLLGHPNEAASLLARRAPDQFSIQLPDGRAVSGPPRVVEAANRLLAYAAVGAPEDSIRATAQRISTVVAAYVSDQRMRADMRAAILMQALSLIYPESRDPFVGATLKEFPRAATLRLRAQLALAAGDTMGARARLDTLWSQRARASTSSVSMDGVDRRAELALALGDTSGAVRELDRVLLALPSVSPRTLEEVAQAGAFMRAMIMRADVARATSDSSTAAHWANAVATLWRNADPSLRSVVRRMQGYTGR